MIIKAINKSDVKHLIDAYMFTIKNRNIYKLKMCLHEVLKNSKMREFYRPMKESKILKICIKNNKINLQKHSEKQKFLKVKMDYIN